MVPGAVWALIMGRRVFASRDGTTSMYLVCEMHQPFRKPISDGEEDVHGDAATAKINSLSKYGGNAIHILCNAPWVCGEKETHLSPL